MTNARDKVAGTAENVRPYVERALNDDELRENVRKAYASGRAIYEQLMARRSVSGAATRLATDAKIQAELRNAVEELREAADRVQGAKRRPEPSHGARNFFLLLTGVAIGVLFNPVTGPAVRRLLGNKLFGGSGDGFTYQDSNGKAGS